MAINLFVPGRLCLFGEHSDWAGRYRSVNAKLVPGNAIVCGIEQGIYATVEKCETFKVTSDAQEIKHLWTNFECNMDFRQLKEVAQSSNFFSYCAGVASYLLEWYKVRGVHIHITGMTMPIQSGLSSSAAICVLVCRAFNLLYGLNLTTKGEMNIAYWGELRTSSRCGRLDQACAFGVRPVQMTFDSDDVTVNDVMVKKTLYWVFADLNSSKDTIKILADLNRAYPFAESKQEEDEQSALGVINEEIVNKAVYYIKKGDAPSLGKLMDEAQDIFDRMVAPMCPTQLKAPKLHQILSNAIVRSLTYGGKGVGSQGDGSVQFLAKGKKSQKALVEYLNSEGMPAYELTIRPRHSVRKAIIPVAGYGTRLYPSTKTLKKDFFPIVDSDGSVKPVILLLLEECMAAGIEEICLVLGNKSEREMYRKFFECSVSEEHLKKMPEEKRKQEVHILEIGKKLRYVYQSEMNGFGDAVAKCADFVGREPVLLLLGDTIYKSQIGKCCALQMIENYESYNKTLVAISEIPFDSVERYGIVGGKWVDTKEYAMNIDRICEKPSISYAGENLGVPSAGNNRKYFGVFGQYILTPEVFSQLKENIKNNIVSERGEIELTTALNQIREKCGLIGVRLNGKSFDIGVPGEFIRTSHLFSQNNI